MKLWKRLTEVKESKRSVMMWDCRLCPALFWSESKANAHIATCKGE
jgi:hypothetical protein